MPTFLKALFVVFALVLAWLGFQLITQGAGALSGIGHTLDAAPAVLGGRFIGMGAALAVLALLSEWRAIAVFLAAGALMGIIDRLVEPAEFGAMHLGFAATCLVLMLAALYMARR